MCGFNSGYHDVNVCYYGRTKVNFNKTQTVRKIEFHHIKRGLLQFLQMLLILIININLHLHPNSNYYCQLNVKFAFLRDKQL